MTIVAIKETSLHRGIRRRLRVVRISPSEEAYVRLVSCHPIEYAEDWTTARSYIQAESTELCRAKLKRAAQGVRE